MIDVGSLAFTSSLALYSVGAVRMTVARAVVVRVAVAPMAYVAAVLSTLPPVEIDPAECDALTRAVADIAEIYDRA